MNRCRTDAGTTFVETILAVALLGFAIVALLGSLMTGVIASDRHASQVDAADVLETAAETVVSPATAKVVCATPSSYEPAADAVAASVGWTPTAVNVTGITYWDGTAYGTTCFDDAAHENLGLQLVTISVTEPENSITRTISVVNGNP